jgi:hypothetical protein
MKKITALLLALLLVAATIISCTDNDNSDGGSDKKPPVESGDNIPDENDDKITDGTTANEAAPSESPTETKSGNGDIIELPRDEF